MSKTVTVFNFKLLTCVDCSNLLQSTQGKTLDKQLSLHEDIVMLACIVI